MKAFVKENTWLTRNSVIDFGWGNGYVAIPKGHPLHGKDYDKIHELMPELSVHCGLTFSDSADELNWDELPKGIDGAWVVGFDTAHFGDSLDMWSKEEVMKEAEWLKEQLEEYVDV